MTDRIVESINADPRYAYDHQAWALNFVCGALQAHNTAMGVSYLEKLDVEFVASAVNLLAERHQHEATPFVFSWHPAVEELEFPPKPPFVDHHIRQAFERAGGSIAAAVNSAAQGKRSGTGNLNSSMRSAADVLVREMERLIDARTGHPSGQVYRNLYQTMVSQVCTLAQVHDRRKLAYLYPLVAKAHEQSPLLVGTLNYDLSIETASEMLGIPCTTGIEDWSQVRTFPVVDKGVQLLKLHGSLDWRAESSQPRGPGNLPAFKVVQDGSELKQNHSPVMVFGRREKLRPDGPFLDLLHAWESGLQRVAALLIIGYSFRDDHINETIRRWINDDAGNHLYVVDPSWSEQVSSNKFKDQLEMHLAPNWPHSAQTPKPRLHVIKATTGQAISLLFGP
jgi:hypothetical protein